MREIRVVDCHGSTAGPAAGPASYESDRAIHLSGELLLQLSQLFIPFFVKISEPSVFVVCSFVCKRWMNRKRMRGIRFYGID